MKTRIEELERLVKGRKATDRFITETPLYAAAFGLIWLTIFFLCGIIACFTESVFSGLYMMVLSGGAIGFIMYVLLIQFPKNADGLSFLKFLENFKELTYKNTKWYEEQLEELKRNKL
jgi:hypothetical protein